MSETHLFKPIGVKHVWKSRIRRPDETGPTNAGKHEKAQAKLAETEVEGEAGNGLVKVVMTCSHVVRKLEISPDLIQEAADDKEMLEDLVLAAINAASEKAEETTNKTMGAFTQGLPAGMGDFFR